MIESLADKVLDALVQIYFTYALICLVLKLYQIVVPETELAYLISELW